MIDYNNHSPQIQQATQGQMHWFFSMDSTNRKASPTDRDVKPQLMAVATR
jgi:hypothetical protein